MYFHSKSLGLVLHALQVSQVLPTHMIYQIPFDRMDRLISNIRNHFATNLFCNFDFAYECLDQKEKF